MALNEEKRLFLIINRFSLQALMSLRGKILMTAADKSLEWWVFNPALGDAIIRRNCPLFRKYYLKLLIKRRQRFSFSHLTIIISRIADSSKSLRRSEFSFSSASPSKDWSSSAHKFAFEVIIIIGDSKSPDYALIKHSSIVLWAKWDGAH